MNLDKRLSLSMDFKKTVTFYRKYLPAVDVENNGNSQL